MERERGRASSRPLFCWSLCAALIAAALGCGRTSEPSRPQIALRPAASRVLPAYVEVTGLSASDIRALRARHLTDADWQALLTITVASDEPSGTSKTLGTPPVQGRYTLKDASITFTPLFPFDPGRSYRVTFDAAKLPDAPPPAAVVSAVVGLPPVATVPSTVVTAIYPSADVLPENLLRMYIEFSAPMGSSGADDVVALVDKTTGRSVDDAFLPVARSQLWSPDHTRYTLIYDPGRVKSGILPNRQAGRPLGAGHRYALEISAAWKDANGLPLKVGSTHEFRAGPEVLAAIKLSDWKIEAPAAGTREPLVVTFPRPLDHGILVRALTIERMRGMGPLTIDGDVALSADDTRWAFTPVEAWLAGEYTLVAQSYLEDPEGNQIGRPFEAAFDEKNEPAPGAYRISFATRDK